MRFQFSFFFFFSFFNFFFNLFCLFFCSLQILIRFFSVDIADEDIPGYLCFDLLVKASNLPGERVSLWCLWNFINMIYWQVIY